MKYWVMIFSLLITSMTFAQSEKEITDLIAKLGSDEFKVREEATEKLTEIGQTALPLLREAENHQDPEVSWRATKIIKRITEKQLQQENIVKKEERQRKQSTPFAKEFEYKGPGFRFKFRFSGNVDDLFDVEKFLKDGDIPEFLKRRQFKHVPKDFIRDIEDFQRQWEDFFSEDNGRDIDRLRRQWQKMLPFNRKRQTPQLKNNSFIFGLQLQKVDEVVRAQLQLKENQGVLVKNISSRGRFANAGFQKWDLILKVNEEVIVSPQQFKEIVDNLDDKAKNTVAIVRRGKPQVIEFVK
ncbi:hypothetical protein [Candidatus Uabimicrobium amorphum]|uniref:PDZ domain-containing protein n=1 Tax=Uabimicrobium amorphum TaxID=2596890 RepID=A0A5S9IPC1_UABAM|nr:hypothetical protein [Candidatus Uabimicrobium amorphum]BBM85217.1 hypothetical protein UABAM_03580 [Candidatus Uabimicrobium amorphum]